MAGLPSQHPTVSLHLADDTLTPLITSSSSRSHLESLTSLTTSALTSQTAAQRVNMGLVERIMVEYPEAGAVVLHSYLDPRRSSDASASSADGPLYRHNRSGSSTSHVEEAASDASTTPGASGPGAGAAGAAAAAAAAAGGGAGPDAAAATAAATDTDAAPRLVGVVVAASHDEAREARRAAARLERVGREFQKEWTAAHGSERTEPQ